MTFDMMHNVLQLSLPSLYRFYFFCRYLSAACCMYAQTEGSAELQTDFEPSNDCAAEYYGFSLEEEDRTSNGNEVDIIRYLHDKSHKFLMLHRYPSVRTVFVRFNMAIPSSGPVERLFSFVGKIHTPARTKLTSNNFRKLLINDNQGKSSITKQDRQSRSPSHST